MYLEIYVLYLSDKIYYGVVKDNKLRNNYGLVGGVEHHVML